MNKSQKISDLIDSLADGVDNVSTIAKIFSLDLGTAEKVFVKGKNNVKYKFHVYFAINLNDFDSDERLSVDAMTVVSKKDLKDFVKTGTETKVGEVSGVKMRSKFTSGNNMYLIHTNELMNREDVEDYLNNLSSSEFKLFIKNSKV